MLDENLPTFRFRPSSENPSTSIVYFTSQGSDPCPEYVFKRADPSTTPAARSKYAAALVDPYSPQVVYAEVVVSPEWQQPSLSGAEIRAQQQQQQQQQGGNHSNGGVVGSSEAAPIPLVPDSFAIQLYNPDQTIPVRMTKSTWRGSEAWEFEIPTHSFRQPSASQLDRQQQAQQQDGGSSNGNNSGNGGVDDNNNNNNDSVMRDIAPKIMFKWKRDGRLSKDMSAYMVGRSLGRHKSKKEPDITVALFKTGRAESAVTIYEPNLQRVEVEDRKGLDIVLLLGAEVIRDLYLMPRQDLFNIAGAAADGRSGRRRNNSNNNHNTNTNTAAAAAAAATGNSNAAATMSGAIGGNPNNNPTADIEAETRRLQAAVAREERERERRDAEEQERIRKMLEAEEKDRRRREAEVERETERLRQMYGLSGQDLPSYPSPANIPALPPRPAPGPRPGSGPSHHPQVTFAPPPLGPPPQQQQLHPGGGGGGGGGGYFGPPPTRPVSAGPSPSSSSSHGPFHSTTLNNWWRGPSSGGGGGGGRGGGRSGEQRPPPPPSGGKVRKKRSTHF